MADYDEDEWFTKEVMDNVKESYATGSDELSEDIIVLLPKPVKKNIHKRIEQLSIFECPKCLVFSDADMNIKINDPVLNEISLIDVPICVVGICGVYRSGKSYLMNRLAQEQKGFSLGSSTRSDTKGIWVWCKPHPKNKGQVLLLLDTEGLADASKGNEEHDMKIFCLTMLLSSAMIYNMKGVIDQDALNKLSFITEITKKVCVSGREYADREEDEKAISIISPLLVLCLRDFFFDLEDGKTPHDYMESCLASDKMDDKFNKLRHYIKVFFPRRRCFVMAQPAMNRDLKHLEILPEDRIDSDFKTDLEKMVKFVYTVNPKRLDEVTKKEWNGNTFETFLRCYISELSMGKMLDFSKSLDVASRFHNSKLSVSIKNKYQKELDKLTIPDPSKLKLLDIAMDIMQTFLREFREGAFPCMVQQFEDTLMKEMKSMMDGLVTKNSRAVHDLCCEYLDKEHEKMVNDNNKKYEEKHGEYERDFNDLLKKYNSEFKDYDKAERCEALQTFRDNTKEYCFMKNYKSRLNTELKTLETVRHSQDAYIRKVFKDVFENIKAEERDKLNKELKSYKKVISEKFRAAGFLKRLHFLFTGKVSE